MATASQIGRGKRGFSTKGKPANKAVAKKPNVQAEIFPGVSLADFLQDRAELIGSGPNMKGVGIESDSMLDQLVSNLQVLEDLLSDGRKFLLSNDRPSLVDAHCWGQIFFIKNSIPSLLSSFPFILLWQDRVSKIEGANDSTPITAHECVNVAKKASLPKLSRYSKELNPNVVVGAQISICPDDYGDFEVVGTLVGSTAYSVTLERFDPSSNRNVYVHFPRAGYYLKVLSKM